MKICCFLRLYDYVQNAIHIIVYTVEIRDSVEVQLAQTMFN